MKVGDVVFLKSGSPPLTVTAVNDNKLSVVWLAGHHTELQYVSLPTECFTDEERSVRDPHIIIK